jgi:hypothetical protein
MNEDSASPDELLEQIQDFLHAQDPLGLDRATLEDFLIIEHLQLVVRAAQVKGYTADLLVTVLLALFSREP